MLPIVALNVADEVTLTFNVRYAPAPASPEVVPLSRMTPQLPPLPSSHAMRRPVDRSEKAL